MPKISELPSTTLDGTEVVPVVKSGITQRVPVNEFVRSVDGASGVVTLPATTVSASDPTGGSDGDVWYKV